MRRSFLFTILFGFCGGIILAELVVLPFFWMTLGVIVGAALCFLLPQPLLSSSPSLGAEGRGEEGSMWRPRLVGILVFSLAIGLIRFQGWTTIGPADLEALAGKRILMTGVVADFPSLEDNRQTFALRKIVVDEQPRRGKISVRLPAYPVMKLGEQLSVGCEITLFNPRSRVRQRAHDIRGYCGQPEIFSSTRAPNDWRMWLAKSKAWTIERLSTSFPEPQSSLLIGILLGRQVPMPEDLQAAFRATGTTHIIALSGFNVTIIITALTALLIQLVGRRWAWLPAMVFVVGFVIMSGASASVTRAGMMSLIVLFALRLGRPVAMLRVLTYSLLLMVWHNPLILVHDLGFQLSFLATAGLVYVAPGLEPFLRWVPQTFSVRENLGTTLGAILMTEPLLLWHFAQVSVVAPLVNILVLPLIPIAMAVGSVSIIVPLAVPAADATLQLILSLIQFGAGLPFALQPLAGWVIGVVASAITLLATRCILQRHAQPTTLA